MMRMIEKVARAFAKRSYGKDEFGFEGFFLAGKDIWIGHARAAIEAMMEPSFDMLDDGCYCTDNEDVPDRHGGDIYHEDSGWTAQQAHNDLRLRFQSMLRAILDEKE